MKKFAILLLLASPAFGAAWTVNTNVTQDTRFTRKLTALNRARCVGLGLAEGCTQAAARNAWCAQHGLGSAPCTVNGETSTSAVRIYATVGDLLDRWLIDNYFAALRAENDAEDKAAWDAWLKDATSGQKDSVCVAAGLSAGCLP